MVVIAEDEESARVASDELARCTVLLGSVTSQGLLEEEEIERVSTFVAVTHDHETNLVAGLLAKRLGAGRAIVLVDNPELVDLVGQLGIDSVISPRRLVIGLTLRHILGRRIRSVAPLIEDQVEVLENGEKRLAVEVEGVDRVVHGFVGTAESEEVRRHGTMAGGGEAGDQVAVEVAPGGLTVQAEEGALRVARSFVEKVQPQAFESREAFQVVGREGVPG